MSIQHYFSFSFLQFQFFMSVSSNNSSPFQDLLLQQSGNSVDNRVINLKANYQQINPDFKDGSIASLKNRKIRVIRKNENAQVCLIKKDGSNIIFSNIVQSIPKDVEIMQIEEQPILPKQPLLPTVEQSYQSRGVEFMYSSFGSHLPSRDTSLAVLGERETMLLLRRRNEKQIKLDKLEYKQGLDLDEQVYFYGQNNKLDVKTLQKIKKQPTCLEALELKIEFILTWLKCIERLKEPLEILPTEKILYALYKQTLVQHINQCCKENKPSKYMYKHSKKDLRDMMDRLIVKIPPFQGNLPNNKPFAFTSNLVGGIPKSANKGAEYAMEPQDVENYHILQDISQTDK